jgi:uncharacterized protein YoxC
MTYWIVGAIVLALIYLGILVYRVVKELGPTMTAAHKAGLTMQKTVEQSQEIGYRMQSISESVAWQGQQIQIIRAYAADTIEQVKLASSVIEPMKFTYRAAKAVYHNHKNGTAKSWLSKLLDKVT